MPFRVEEFNRKVPKTLGGIAKHRKELPGENRIRKQVLSFLRKNKDLIVLPEEELSVEQLTKLEDEVHVTASRPSNESGPLGGFEPMFHYPRPEKTKFLDEVKKYVYSDGFTGDMTEFNTALEHRYAFNEIMPHVKSAISYIHQHPSGSREKGHDEFVSKVEGALSAANEHMNVLYRGEKELMAPIIEARNKRDLPRRSRARNRENRKKSKQESRKTATEVKARNALLRKLGFK